LEIRQIPNETVTLSPEEMESFKRLLSFLEDVDDVQDIYHNVVMD
jgi:transcriptional/translational regulatory protein YebC/TACO1